MALSTNFGHTPIPDNLSIKVYSDPLKCNLVFADAEFQFTFLTQQR
jgi:hypothetical protein